MTICRHANANDAVFGRGKIILNITALLESFKDIEQFAVHIKFKGRKKQLITQAKIYVNSLALPLTHNCDHGWTLLFGCV